MSDIEDLQAKVSRLKDQLSTASKSLHEALVRDSGFTRGEVVQVGKDRGIVHGFKFHDYSGPVTVIPIVHKLTKAGAAHATATLYVWELKDVQKVTA